MVSSFNGEIFYYWAVSLDNFQNRSQLSIGLLSKFEIVANLTFFRCFLFGFFTLFNFLYFCLVVFEIDNIELNFGENKILKAVYLKAETGKITGIFGRNGSGKSSLMRIIFGSLKPKNKLFRIDGKVFSKNPYRSGIVKFLPQNNFLPNNFLLAEIFEIFQVDWAEFRFLFDTFSKYEHYKINELSGGEIRLVQAYLITKSQAELLLLDEPFSHISPIHIEKLKKIILQEKQKKAIIATDHLFREILEIADDLYLLKEGFSHRIVSEENLQFHGYLR